MKLYCQKLIPREQFSDSKGNIIDDGANNPIVLCSSDNDKIIEYLYNSMITNTSDKVWKIWKE